MKWRTHSVNLICGSPLGRLSLAGTSQPAMAYGSLYSRQSMSTCERTFADPRALTMRQDTLSSFLRGPIYFGVLSDEGGSEGRGKMERTSEIQQRLAPLVPRCERVSSASSIPPPERRQLRLRCWSEEGVVDRRYPRARDNSRSFSFVVPPLRFCVGWSAGNLKRF